MNLQFIFCEMVLV